MADFINHTDPDGPDRGMGWRVLQVALSLWAAQESAAAYFVYVSFESDNAVGVYQMNPDAGALELTTTVSVPGGPASLTLGLDQKVMYASQRSAKTLSSFAVNPVSGGLTLMNTITAPENPVFIATDRAGKYLLSAYYGGARMAVHAIGADGKLVAEPVENRVTETNPHSIMTDPSNRFLYVPSLGAGKILQFRFDATTGKVQPLDPPEVASAAGAGPRHFTFHGAKDIMYLVNEKNRSVTVYAMDLVEGTLSPLQTLSTVPSSYTGDNACADIHLTPDNKFLYASNRGHQSLVGYRVDPSTGQLAYIGNTPTQQTPRSFAIDPTGKFLFAAGQSSDSLASYRINQTTGALEPMKVYATGESPAWVIAVHFQDGSVPLRHADSRLGKEGNPLSGKSALEGSRYFGLSGRLLSGPWGSGKRYRSGPEAITRK